MPEEHGRSPDSALLPARVQPHRRPGGAARGPPSSEPCKPQPSAGHRGGCRVTGQLGPGVTRRRRQDLALACRPLRGVL